MVCRDNELHQIFQAISQRIIIQAEQNFAKETPLPDNLLQLALASKFTVWT